MAALGAEPVLVPGDLEWGLKVSARDLDRASNKLTRGLILCSPCNPTGAVYTLAELRSIAEWARANDVWIISDEIYRRINYGPGPAPSLLDLPDELLERTVIIYGASKAYAMTGWRIGAALAPAHLTKAMAALQSHTTTGANQPAMWAAAAAFTDEKVDAEVSRMVSAFRRRRDTLVERFRREAQLAAKLSHPNVVAVYGADRPGIVHRVATVLGEYRAAISQAVFPCKRAPRSILSSPSSASSAGAPWPPRRS